MLPQLRFELVEFNAIIAKMKVNYTTLLDCPYTLSCNGFHSSLLNLFVAVGKFTHKACNNLRSSRDILPKH
jgi:hypothetical protein